MPGPHLKPGSAALDEAAARFRQLRDRPDDPELQQALRAWMSADPEHARAADLVAGAWSSSAGAAALPRMRALRRSAHDAEPRFGEARSRPMTLRLAVMVVVLLAVVGSVAIAMMDTRMVRENYVTARAERLDVVLPDGSKLRINGDSEVRVGFGWLRRDVQLLRGEAEFVVAKDQLRPFVVDAGTMSVHAVGTDFTVRLEGEAVSVVLVEGLVALRPTTASFAPVMLHPGSKAVLSKGVTGPAVRKVDIAGELAWRDGLLMFNRTPLAEALREFARYTGHRVSLQAADLGRLEISGSFRTTDLQPFLEIVSRIHPVQWQRRDDGTFSVDRR